MSDRTPAPADESGLPVSARIRARIQAARRRFHANDNIADFLQPGDLEQLLDEVEGRMKGVLESLVIDTESDHNTQDTARRVAKMYINEVFRGRYVRRPSTTDFPNGPPFHRHPCLFDSLHHGPHLNLPSTPEYTRELIMAQKALTFKCLFWLQASRLSKPAAQG